MKATYTRSSSGAKASIRYIEHRRGKDGAQITRPLWGSDGLLGRYQAYRMIDEAEQGSFFYRFIISPDMKTEDVKRDVSLRDIIEATMLTLEDRFHRHLQWVAATHDDHTQYRHVHLLAIIQERLNVQDFQALRQTATEEALQQRRHLDLAHTTQTKAQEQEEAAWERER